MKASLGTAAAAVLIGSMALAGCGGTDAKSGSASSSDNPTTSTSPLPDDVVSEETPTPTPTEADAPAAFGSEGYSYDDGLEISVGKLSPYTPTDTASFRKSDKRFVKFTVTIKNGTAGLYDPTQLSTSATTGEREAEQVFEGEGEIGGSPQTKILAGHVKKFTSAYGVDPGKDFVLQIEPGYDDQDQGYATALFAS